MSHHKNNKGERDFTRKEHSSSSNNQHKTHEQSGDKHLGNIHNQNPATGSKKAAHKPENISGSIKEDSYSGEGYDSRSTSDKYNH
jgi:hypothetical protein